MFCLAEREDWRVENADAGLFEFIKVWVENSFLVELMTPEMTRAYVVVFGAEGAGEIDAKLRALENGDCGADRAREGCGGLDRTRCAEQADAGGDQPHGEGHETADGDEAENLSGLTKRDRDAFVRAGDDERRRDEADRRADAGAFAPLRERQHQDEERG